MAVCFDGLNEGACYIIHVGPGDGTISHFRICWFKGLDLSLPLTYTDNSIGERRKLIALFVDGNGTIVEVLIPGELMMADRYDVPMGYDPGHVNCRCQVFPPSMTDPPKNWPTDKGPDKP